MPRSVISEIFRPLDCIGEIERDPSLSSSLLADDSTVLQQSSPARAGACRTGQPVTWSAPPRGVIGAVMQISCRCFFPIGIPQHDIGIEAHTDRALSG